MMEKTKIINLFGAPGAGKTTITTELFSLMKRKGINVEMALEYAKELVWENKLDLLNNQLEIFKIQKNRIDRLLNKVEYIITDSPLLLSMVYNKNDNKELNNMFYHQFKNYNNINFFIERGKQKYKHCGRIQNENEAEILKYRIYDVLNEKNVEYSVVKNDENSAKIIYNIIKKL